MNKIIVVRVKRIAETLSFSWLQFNHHTSLMNLTQLRNLKTLQKLSFSIALELVDEEKLGLFALYFKQEGTDMALLHQRAPNPTYSKKQRLQRKPQLTTSPRFLQIPSHSPVNLCFQFLAGFLSQSQARRLEVLCISNIQIWEWSNFY